MPPSSGSHQIPVGFVHPQERHNGKLTHRSIIDRFDEPSAFLSNFAACPVTYGDEGDMPITYRSVEHAFQAAKTLDPAGRERLRSTGSPLTAKRLGRRVAMRPGWLEMRLEVMKVLLRQKFSREPFRSELLATGDAKLIEGNTWHDQFWGKCNCAQHRAEPGENALGCLIMEVRDELRGLPGDHR